MRGIPLPIEKILPTHPSPIFQRERYAAQINASLVSDAGVRVLFLSSKYLM